VEAFGKWGRAGQQLKDRLIALIDEDTDAFNQVMAAYRLPKGTATEKADRKMAIEAANQHAARIPFQIMETAFQTYPLLAAMAQEGNPASSTDVGVGAHCAHTAIEGAALNVRINLGSIKDEDFIAEMKTGVADMLAQSAAEKAKVLVWVEEKMG